MPVKLVTASALLACALSGQQASRPLPLGGPGASPNTVWILATVTNAQGQLVRTLGKEDFVLTHDSEPRNISVFSTEPVPVSVALMLDMSGSMEQVVPNVSLATDALVSQFKRGDRINIGTFKTNVLVSARFTANRDQILGRSRQMILGAEVPCSPPSRPLGNAAVTSAFARRGGSAIWDGVECAIWALDRDTEAFRRVVLLVSDGNDNASYGNIVTATNFANRTGVIVYAIGMSRGLTADEMATLATATGGSYFYLDRRADFTEAFRQVGEEIHAQYILGFEPADPDKKGLIDVRLKPTGLKVRARQVYAPKQK